MLSNLLTVICLVLVYSVAANPISNTVKVSDASGSVSWAIDTNTQCASTVVPVIGDYCEKIARTAGISTKWFIQQNPQVDEKCSNLWTNTRYCVDPPKGQPSKDGPTDSEGGGHTEAKNQTSESKGTDIVFPEGKAGVILHNKSPDSVCFAFEVGAGVSVSNMPPPSVCQVGLDSYAGIVVPPGQSRFHRFFPGFNGAISTIVNNRRGARHEITFVSGKPPGAFYDVDYEYGLTSSTFGPFDGRRLSDGGDSLLGEEDILAKVNQHFQELSPEEQQALVTATGNGLIRQGAGGDLIWIDNDKAGHEQWWYFLQCIAEVRGYAMPGSEVDKTPIPFTTHAKMVAAADNSTKEVLTQQFLLTVYPDRRQVN